MEYPKASILILNWNGHEDTAELLESLKKITYPNYEVVVIDNASEGNDIEVLEAGFGEYIQTIQNDTNCGVGEGFNSGIRHVRRNSKPDYILLMNNDIVVAPDFLDELVRAAESDDRIGIVGPKIYYYDYNGRKDMIWSAGGRVRWWGLKIHTQIGEGDKDLPKYQAESEVDWISGCVLMFCSSLTEKVGLLNPWYFIGHEDIEFCLKARKQGYSVVYVPAAKVWHKVGVSTKKAHISFADPSAYYYLIRQCFPLPVYIYQLSLMPFLLSRWALLYVLRYRDTQMLRRFLRNFIRFILRRGKESL